MSFVLALSLGILADKAVFDRVRVAEGWRVLMDASILATVAGSVQDEGAVRSAEPTANGQTSDHDRYAGEIKCFAAKFTKLKSVH